MIAVRSAHEIALGLIAAEERDRGQVLEGPRFPASVATVVEGRLMGVNPYGQPGVEAYKRNMKAILKG